MTDIYTEQRLAKNDASRDHADNYRQPWGADEVALLLTWDRTDDELTEMSLILGRTREACRERFYLTLRLGTSVTTTITTTATATDGGWRVTTASTATTLYQANWADDDRCEWYA